MCDVMIVNLQFKLIYGNNPCNCVVRIDKCKANFKRRIKMQAQLLFVK